MEYLSRQSPLFQISLGLVLTVIIGLIDYGTGEELSVSILYLLPISMVTWLVGRGGGILISTASALIWLAADLISGPVYSHLMVHYWNMTVTFGFFFVVTLTLSALKKALEGEKKLARVDSLTGVANLRYFYEFCYREMERARRNKHSLALAYIDIDNFKIINDYFGHSTGDILLQSVTKTIKENIRPMDMVARLGGDEFVILLTEIGPTYVQMVITRIQKSLLELMRQKGWSVTFSIGVVTFISPPAKLDDMIRTADSLMYTVKNSGKNNIKYKVYND